VSAARISVCVPTYNGERWIGATLRSVLAQDEDLEVIVSDDSSSDATVDIAGAMQDPRIRVLRAEGRLGMARNWNRAVELSKGRFVKLLMQDDELLPGTLSTQASLLERHATAGLAFGPRLLESDGSPQAARWMARYHTLHSALGPLRDVLPGRDVIAALTRGRLRANAIGEPSVVMLRRSVLDATGLFNVHLRQLTDLDLWIRVAAVSDIAFDSRPVARFRVHADSATARNRHTADAWLDRLWIVDGLARNPTTSHAITVRHYATALGAGALELAGALVRRRRSLGASIGDIRQFLASRSGPADR